MILGAFLLFGLLRRLGNLTNRQLGYGVAITLILGTVAFPASETMRREFGSKTTLDTVQEDAKIRAWPDALRMARDYPVTGIGRGAFRSVFPSYYRVLPGLKVTYSHAENLVVQLFVELGPVIFGVLLLVISGVVFRFFQRTKLDQVQAIALLPILVLLVQNLVDFNLEFPGTGYLLMVLLGILAGLGRGRTRRVVAQPGRAILLAGWLTFVAAGGLALATLGVIGTRYDLRTEGKQIQTAINRGDKPAQSLGATREAIRRHPADFYLHHLAGVAAMNVVGELPLRHFNRALYLNPRSGATQRQVGRALWKLGFPQQALVHYTAAIGLGIPVRGNVAGELYALLGRLWETGAPAQARTEASLCAGALALPGQVPAPSCLLAEGLTAVQRSRGFSVIARLDPAVAAVFARRLVVDKRWAPALSAYQRILAREPQSAEVLKALVELTFRDGDLALALHYCEALVGATHSASAYVRLGQIHLRAGRAGLAEKAADAGLGRYPRSPALVALKAELLLERGAYSLARSMIREMTVGRSLEMRDELRLLRLRLRIERHDRNQLRVERIKARILQIQRLQKAGVRGSSIQR
jgi:Flp pilus assembly protein TadD